MKSGYIALVGSPNVGKSTLLNHLLQQKLSITSRRPQTTRHSIVGIKTTDQGQMVFVDTPGMHDGGGRAMNRYLNRTAHTALVGVDVIVWLLDKPVWQDENVSILNKIKAVALPVILVVNKIDQCSDKTVLLPFIDAVREHYPFADIIPISALKAVNIEQLENKILELLPEGNLIYPEDQVTDRSERFFVAEIVREKLTRRLSQELPHALSVEIDKFEVQDKITHIHAVIWVEREGQKRIVIGNKGEVLKQVGQQAREDIEAMLEGKVYLNLWVKVKKGWSDDERMLQNLGYMDS